MKVPMREKYVDEAAGIWIIFGTNGIESDVSDQNRDIFCNLPHDVAVQVVAAQGRFRNELYKILCYEDSVT